MKNKLFNSIGNIDNKFDKHFEKVDRWAKYGLVFAAIIYLSTLSFIGWAIVKVMQHFGII